ARTLQQKPDPVDFVAANLTFGAMNTALAITVCVIFLVLALWHFRMALAPAGGESGAVPSVDGKPLFVPSTLGTVAGGVILASFAALVAVTAGLLPLAFPKVVSVWLSYGVALGL